VQFWDSSALLPLVVWQPPFSEQCRRAFRTTAPRAVAFLARVECRAAIERLVRAGTLKSTARRRALTQVDKLVAGFDVVAFSAEVEAYALELVHRYALRSLDALQLGCARTLSAGAGANMVPELLCCDRRLADAAASEGYPLLIDV
jgi:predicted nucleic acid-binding protein